MTDTDHRVGSVIAAVLAFLALCIVVAHAADAPVIPDPAVTPGVVNPAVTQDNIGSTICVRGWTKTIRPTVLYTNRLKRIQLAARGQAYVDPRLFEEDHRVPLEVGGHPTDEGNLWPEVWESPWGAKVKDRLENAVHAAICSGKMTLAEGQAVFLAPDWRTGYCTLVGRASCPP